MGYAPIIFYRSPITRSWPLWARYGTVVVLVALATIVQAWLWPAVAGHPFVVFYGVVVLAAALFDHGAGYFAVALSGLVVTFMFIEPLHQLAMAHERDRLGLVAFTIIGCGSSALLENMHVTLHRLSLANEQLLRSDKEKDLLLSEFSHRIKNDLTVLLSLLLLQERELVDPTARAALAATAERIKVISRVQERLRRTDLETVVDAGEFINELCSDLQLTLIGLRPITLSIVTAPGMLLPHSHAVALGLTINELLTNAVKHAFPDDRNGKISVRFTQHDSGYELQVADDGVGTAAQHATGLGQRLIRTMVAQLNGSIQTQPTTPSGTTVVIQFPRP